MGWFGKKQKEELKKPAGEPFLPELPRLPEIPERKGMSPREKIPQLPSYPNSSLGKKFSQDSIKEAVVGGKGDDEDIEADDFALEQKLQMMPSPSTRTRELSEDLPEVEMSKPLKSKSYNKVIEAKREPVFIRIDKFEESLDLFEKIKSQISEIEKTLKETKKIKEEEEEEMVSWEKDVQSLKTQIEKIDRDIFSKVE